MRDWGKGQGWPAEVADVFNLDPYFIEHFPFYRFFQGFSRLPKTGQDAVDPRGKMALARHEELIAALHQDNHRRSQAGKVEKAALRAIFGPLLGPGFEGDSAAPAEPVGPVPFDDLPTFLDLGEKVLVLPLGEDFIQDLDFPFGAFLFRPH